MYRHVWRADGHSVPICCPFLAVNALFEKANDFIVVWRLFAVMLQLPRRILSRHGSSSLIFISLILVLWEHLTTGTPIYCHPFIRTQDAVSPNPTSLDVLHIIGYDENVAVFDKSEVPQVREKIWLHSGKFHFTFFFFHYNFTLIFPTLHYNREISFSKTGP